MWPGQVHEYAIATITPDGGLAVASGSTLYKYHPTANPFVWQKEFAYKDCPHPPRSYPQTGARGSAGAGGRALWQSKGGSAACRMRRLRPVRVPTVHAPSPSSRAGPGLPLAMYPPHNKMFFLWTGGSAALKAGDDTPGAAAVAQSPHF